MQADLLGNTKSKNSFIPFLALKRIPIRNIWFFLLYASDFYKQISSTKRVELEDSIDDLPDLIGEMLVRAVQKKLKRNLTNNYCSVSAVQSRLRGKINIEKTYSHRLMEQGKVSCRYYKLTVNTHRNCYIRSALEILSQIVSSSRLSHTCRSLVRQFNLIGVTSPTPTRAEISKERFSRHDASDAVLFSLAKLVFNLKLPTQFQGAASIHTPLNNINWFRHLFEKGIAGFYETALSLEGWKVKAGRKMDWQIDSISSGMKDILPTMKTDIQLDQPTTGRRIIIDTKFNNILVRGWYRDLSIRNGYMYQIYSYLRSQEDNKDPSSLNAEGVLLHPAINTLVNESVTIQGHCIRCITVDFSKHIKEIRKQMLQIVKEFTIS